MQIDIRGRQKKEMEHQAMTLVPLIPSISQRVPALSIRLRKLKDSDFMNRATEVEKPSDVGMIQNANSCNGRREPRPSRRIYSHGDVGPTSLGRRLELPSGAFEPILRVNLA